jgi:LPS sulfotransferase NodH
MQAGKGADMVNSMEHEDVIVMLARQRSGTNPLRDVLDSHPDLFCTPEVFHDRPSPDADLEVETNFFRFVEQHPKGRTARAHSWAEQKEIFRDFLAFLRKFTEKRFVILDVKYNSTHHLNASWKFISAEPTLFPIIRGDYVRVLNLTRRNFLRYHLSQCKAERTQTWAARADRGHKDDKIEVDIDAMFLSLELCRAENEVIDKSFEHYGRYLNIDYAELFPVMGEPVSDDALGRVAEWLGLEATFQSVPTYRKQAVLGLRETIENYEEVEEALRGTAFDYCLEDEPMYRERPTEGVD